MAVDTSPEHKSNDNSLTVSTDWLNVWTKNRFDEGIVFSIRSLLNDWPTPVKKLISKEYAANNNSLQLLQRSWQYKPIMYVKGPYLSKRWFNLFIELAPITTAMLRKPGFKTTSKMFSVDDHLCGTLVRLIPFRKSWTLSKVSTEPRDQLGSNLNLWERPKLLDNRVTRSVTKLKTCWYCWIGRESSRNRTKLAGLFTQALMQFHHQVIYNIWLFYCSHQLVSSIYFLKQIN